MKEKREKNSMEPTQLPHTSDPDEAAAILAGLQEKKEAGILCLYPGCRNSRQPSTGKSGRRKGYCALEEHNITTAFQERQRLKALVEGVAQESSSPAGKGSPTTLKGSIIGHILHLQEEMSQYITALREIGDPDLFLAQIQVVEDQASIRIAEAEGRVNAERSLRLTAEKAREEAEGESQEAKETAEAAIQEMEEVQERAQLQSEEAGRRIAEILSEKERAIALAQAEAQRQIEEIQAQAGEAIDQAQAATTQALEQARKADIRTNTAETEARVLTAAAERSVSEANATLERERAEARTQLERLQGELTDAREQIETERIEFRTEVGRLRQELTDAGKRAEVERSEAHTTLERERAEVGRLRQDLTEERQRTEQANQRADRLARVADELRDNLLQIQAKEKVEPKEQ
jgi:chemotaxis protein histidine kinase CheA